MTPEEMATVRSLLRSASASLAAVESMLDKAEKATAKPPELEPAPRARYLGDDTPKEA